MFNNIVSNITVSEWVMYSLIIVAIVAIIIALIWTKVIKPNTFSYTSKSYFFRRKLKSQAKELIEDNKLEKYLDNIIIRSDTVETYCLERIAFSNKVVYLFSDALYYDIKKVKKDKGNYKTVNKKNQEKNIPGNLFTFIKGAKLVKNKLLKQNEVCIIIPTLNKQFDEIEIDNIHFVKLVNVKDFIAKYEKTKGLKKGNEKKLEKFQKLIKINKKRRFFAKNDSSSTRDMKKF